MLQHLATILQLWLLLVVCSNSIDLSAGSTRSCPNKSGVWSWVCKKGECVRVKSSTESSTEFNTCKLTCGKYSVLFPKPTGYTYIGNSTIPFLVDQVKLAEVRCADGKCPFQVAELAQSGFKEFKNTLQKVYNHSNVHHRTRSSYYCKNEAIKNELRISISLSSNRSKIKLDTDESYSLRISSSNHIVSAAITAQTYFGARHAFETISQLIAYMRSNNSLQIVSEVLILEDKPSYRYRGIILDTSRNFFSVNSILRLISAMSYNKMNTLHWHITDSQSFPIEIKSVPEFNQYGAYSEVKIYTHEDVRLIVKYGLIHGVRIVPEFDQPAHCGEGWQWGPASGLGDLVVCLDKRPWYLYCKEPPCGQLNPTNPNLYNVLGRIYSEYLELFEPDLFHAGGDEIDINCWNTTKEINAWVKNEYSDVTEASYMELWGYFIKQSSKKLVEANNGKEIPLIFWSSKITSPQYIEKYLDPAKHIIQLWTKVSNRQIASVMKKGFKTIFSNYDVLYLDCGYGNWVGGQGNNWCSPYKDWKLMYMNDPIRILKNLKVNITDEIRENILGQETAMWSEQVDEYSSESKIWPRTAALAERLWSDPTHDWREAVSRMVYHRERLVERGIKADSLQPFWCLQNTGHCT